MQSIPGPFQLIDLPKQSWIAVTVLLLFLPRGYVNAEETKKASPRPNRVLIIADDMNWDDCGAHGNSAIRTPNIDRLASTGLRFQHAYLTTNSCSSSRSSLITGKYPHNAGA